MLLKFAVLAVMTICVTVIASYPQGTCTVAVAVTKAYYTIISY